MIPDEPQIPGRADTNSFLDMIRYEEQSDATCATPHFQVMSAAKTRWNLKIFAQTFKAINKSNKSK